MVNKNIIFLFLLTLFNSQRVSSSIISKRATIVSSKPGVISCERVDKLVVECEGSSSIKLSSNKELHPVREVLQVSKNKINLTLVDDGWEFFSFSKPGETKSFILDFWKKRKINTNVVTKVEDKVKLNASAGNKSKKTKQLKRSKKRSVSKKVKKAKRNKDLDFRYGSVFFWDNPALEPDVKIDFDYKRKTPDKLLNIKDRQVEKSDEEAHLQLTYNLFKKMKWGLMYKSIDLFNQKYPKSKNQDFNEFLKMNSLLKERYINGMTTPTKDIISRLKLFVETSDNELFNLAITRYLLAFYVDTDNPSMVLETATNLYVLARDNYYPEVLTKSLEFILQGLSKKGDVDKIKKLLSDTEVKKFLPVSRVKEFETYALLVKNKSERIVLDEKKSKGMRIGDLPKSRIYNLAESYFREADYKKAIKYFDKFISNYSGDNLSSKARIRIALCYEIMNKELPLVKRLYKNAMNRSTSSEDRYEAAIRYVGAGYLRAEKKMKLSDAETFLEAPKSLQGKELSNDLKNLLWITRLRSLIVSEKYNLAFDYYNNLPLENIQMKDRKVFYGDFSEIILGKMFESFNKKDYADVIKTYSAVENRKNYFVPKRSGHFYIEAASYLSLGVEKSSSESLKRAREIDTEDEIYPSWVSSKVISELRNTVEVVKFELGLKDKNYDQSISAIKKIKSANLKLQLKMKLSLGQKKYSDFLKQAEEFILKDYNQEMTKQQQSDFVENYTFALIMNGKFNKAKKIIMASIENETLIKNGVGKLEYIFLNLIEYFSSPKNSDEEFLSLLNEYNQKFPDGKWRSKIDFVTAKRNLSKGREKEGIKNLEKVINNNKTKDYLKELAKSELALIKIKQKTI